MRKLIARYIEKRLDTQMKDGRDRLVRLNDNLRLDRLESWHTHSRRLLPVQTFLQIT